MIAQLDAPLKTSGSSKVEFEPRTSDEETAAALLQNYNILPSKRICENGHEMRLSFGEDLLWRCGKKTCRRKIGFRNGTWLENSKLPLSTVLHFIYCWANKMTSGNFCSEELNMSTGSFVHWSSRLREVCAWKIEQKNVMVGGEGKIVEIDESIFLVQRRNKTGNFSPHQSIFGGICRETKECFVEKVQDHSAKTLLPIILKRVRPGSKIISDRWEVYRDLLEARSNHGSDNRQYNFVDPVTLADTQMVDKMWGAMEWNNKLRRGTARNCMESHLAEFMWRTKLDGRDPFEAIMEDISLFSLSS